MQQNCVAENRRKILNPGLNQAEKTSSCALVLAGGEGKRLRSFIHLLRGDLLPKQYVNFIGRRSMLEHTWDRAEKLTAPSRVFTIVNQGHLLFPDVRRQISSRPPGTVVVQPENKETAPGILFALLHIAKRYPNSIVTLLPSDHFIWEEEEMAGYLKTACRWVRREPSRIVLVGVEPDRHESEYGYIVTAARLRRGNHRGSEITSFVEKPDHASAQQLARAGALWNTMMMVFHIRTIFDLIQEIAPEVFRALRPIDEAIGTAKEKAVTEKVYRDLLPVNFSKEILEPLARTHSSQIIALPVRDILWSDWGSEARIMEILRSIGYESRLNGLPRRHDAVAPLSHEHDRSQALPRTAKERIHPQEIVPVGSDASLVLTEL